jgi:hypothetical protein
MNRRLGAIVSLLFLPATLASCAGVLGGGRSPTDGSSARLPGPGAVRDGRFVKAVALDRGRLVVEPAPAGMRPAFSERQAAAEIWASPSMSGGRPEAVLGFGLVTTRISAPDVPSVRRLPAWVGFAGAPVFHCPMEPAASGTPTASTLPGNGYVAVVLGARNGIPAFAYAARSSFCERPAKGPGVSMPTKTLSIPWRQIGPRSGDTLTISYQLPPCGLFVSSNASGGPAAVTLEVEATTPDEPLPCPAPVTKTMPVNVGEAAAVRHAALGLVSQIRH